MPRPELTDQRTYSGHDQPNVIVTVDAEHPEGNLDGLPAGTFHGSTRMAGRDAEGRWWRMVTWSTSDHRRATSWFPDTHVRPTELDDFVGIIPPDVLERMRAAEAASPDVGGPS